MQNYNNSYLNGFKVNSAQTFSGGAKPSVPENSPADKLPFQNEIPNAAPDYNVTTPAGYTKIGVEKLFNGQEIHCYKLSNGQRVMIAPMDSPMTMLNTYVNTGSMNEKDDERGISHFCEHMAFNGTKGTDGYMKLGVGDIYRTTDNMGGYTNASTNFAETNYTISIPEFNKGDFEKIVKMQSAMMNNLEMSDAMTEKEHGPVTSEISMYSDMPNNIATNAAVKNLYGINTSSDDIVAGTIDNILNTDSKKVTDYYKNNYYPANMTTVVTGNVNPDEVIELISKNFRGTNPKNPERRFEPLKPVDKTVRKDIISDKAIAASGCVCFNGPANNDIKDNLIIEAVNDYIFNKDNSLANKNLDKYGVQISAGFEKISTIPKDGKLLSINYTSTEENSEIALKSIFDNLANFKSPNEEEIETIKTSLKMKYEKMFDNYECLNYLIGQNSFANGTDFCTQAVNVIDGITAEDMVNAVHKYYDINKASAAVVHPPQANADSLKENYNKAKSISFTGNSHKKPLDTESVEKYTLENNCDVAVINSKNDIANFMVNITSNVPANTKPGVKEVLASMLNNEIKNYKDITDKNNITIYSNTTNTDIFYNAELPVKNLALSLELMNKNLFSCSLSEENFKSSKAEVKSKLQTVTPNAYDNMQGMLFSDSPLGYSLRDVLAGIDDVSIEDVRGLYKYLLDNGSITFAASLPKEKYPQIKSVIDNELSKLPAAKPNKPRVFNDYVPISNRKVVMDKSNTSQADIQLAYKFKSNHTPKELACAAIVENILSKGDDTGLFNNLREKEKLAYDVRASVENTHGASSILSCSILTTTDADGVKSYDNVQKSINGFHKQIGKMVNGEFTDKEFEAAKLSRKRYLLSASDSALSKTMALVDGLNSPYGVESINKQYEIIDSITREDIQNTAKEIFKTIPTYSVRASKAALDANKEFLEQLEEGAEKSKK